MVTRRPVTDADIKDRRQNIFPKEHKHTSLDSVFDSLRGDNLCFWQFIRVKMVQHCHESPTGLTPLSPCGTRAFARVNPISPCGTRAFARVNPKNAHICPKRILLMHCVRVIAPRTRRALWSCQSRFLDICQCMRGEITNTSMNILTSIWYILCFC